MMINKKLLSFIILFSGLLNAESIVDTLVEKTTKPLRQAGPKLFADVVEKRQKQYEELKKEHEELVKEKSDKDKIDKAVLEEVKNNLKAVEEGLSKSPENEFLKRKSNTLGETSQVIQDVLRVREQVADNLNDILKLLKNYVDDPDFSQYKKDKKLTQKLFVSFDDVQSVQERIINLDKRINQLQEQEKNAQSELENRKRIATNLKETFKTRKEEIESLAQEKGEATLNAEQLSELSSLEEQLYAYKTLLNQLRTREMELKIDSLGNQLFVSRAHREILKEYLKTIKPSIRISEADIQFAYEELCKERQQIYNTKEKLRQELNKLNQDIKKKEAQLVELSSKYSVPTGIELTNWTRDPKDTLDSYVGLCEVGALNTQLKTLEYQSELLDAQINAQDEKLKFATLQAHVKESYHKIHNRKFESEDDITIERKKYEAPRSEANSDLAQYTDKIRNVADQLNSEKNILDRIIQIKQEIELKRDTIFKNAPQKYQRCIALLNQSEKEIRAQSEVLTKTTGFYSGIAAALTNTLHLINFIILELESITIFHRPEGAITWTGVKSIIPDMLSFFSDLQSYFTRLDFTAAFNLIKTPFSSPFTFLFFCIKLLAVIILLLVSRAYLPTLFRILLQLSEKTGSNFLYIITLFGAALTSFFTYHFKYLAIWIVLFALLLFYPKIDIHIFMLFYLLSIPYLIYIATKFVRFLAQFNIRHDYAFLAQDFQRRFVLVLSTLLYATITIFFFRRAFILGNYYSELPNILLAVNFIIFQICLILLIDKEQILNLIPTKNNFWQWAYEQVRRFYYLILLLLFAIIIMSNPYVGYGRLVLYVLFALIYTSLLITILFWLHGFFKRLGSKIFFSTTDDVVRERFSNAKTWFGFFIIISFLLLSVLGIIVVAKIWDQFLAIWGWQFTYSDMKNLLYEPIILGDAERPITLISFFRIMIFIVGGFITAYALNKFVLDKIFDLLLIDPGIQHTVGTIAQYLVIVTAIVLGFNNVGLSFLVNVLIGGLILGLGWILKDPIGDFVAYFIILVQRPIKIGDYVKIDSDTMGVVRKITARSVVLRRKNSFTIIVPNTYVITHSITNWNYSRTFFAFPDITVAVDYQEDPTLVRSLLLQIIDEHPNVLKNPKPIVRLDKFGEYGYEFTLRAFLSSDYTLQQWDISSEIRLAVVERFKKEDIELALPIRLLLQRQPGAPGYLGNGRSQKQKDTTNNA